MPCHPPKPRLHPLVPRIRTPTQAAQGRRRGVGICRVPDARDAICPTENQRKGCSGTGGARVARQTSVSGRSALDAPSPLPTTLADATGDLSLHPAGAYLQAIGRPGAETAPAARGFRLPPHPRTAAPPAAVRGRRSPPRVPPLPAPPRRSDPRRAASRPARARGEQWTGSGGAGWGGAGGRECSAGDQERRRAGGAARKRRPARH